MSLYSDVEMIENAIDGLLYGDEPLDIAALDNLFQAKQQTIERGLESLCKVRARKEGDIAALKAEATRMREKAESEERALVRLEQYMLDMFKRSGEKKLTAGTFTIGTRTSNSVWVSPDFNDPKYMRTTTTTAPDKIALKEALKAGAKIDGAYMVEKENLAVK
jgi:hypothetical protein